LGVKGLARDRLGLIAPVAASAVPPLVTAAVPRDVRLPAVASRLAVVPRPLDEGWLAKAGIDPCEKKKTKRREFARWREGVLPGRRYHGHGVSIVTFFSWKTGTKFSKKIRFR
jgi:hypothetical protein